MDLRCFLSLCLLSGNIIAQPIGYYNDAQGLSGEPLRTALHSIINNHNAQLYADLWSYFQNTDQKTNGKVWDIYSDNPSATSSYEYNFTTDQCGQYSGEGDCYNREHSIPHSWFSAASPMYTDLFHVYPTDGFVNGKRANYPFGEVNNPSWVSTNGSKLGNHSLIGYSGVVFEPIDEYKGDLARTYFYMVTRYLNVAQNWTADMLDGNTLADWALNMLLTWSANDPVSQKEIDRNEAIFQIQNNRNPFIDYPDYARAIWDSTYVGVSPDRLSNTGIVYNNKMLNIHVDHPTQLLIFDIAGKPILQFLVNHDNSLPIALPSGYYIAVLIQDGIKKNYSFTHINN